MDVTNIGNTTNSLYSDYSSQFAKDRAEKKTNGEEQEQQDKGARTIKPSQVHNESTIRPELVNGYHGLTVQQARRTVGELSALIGRTNPWKLAETQPVLDRNLLDGGYY